MKTLLLTALLTAFSLNVGAQTDLPKKEPQLEFALQLKVTLGEAFSIENTQHGRRTVIPITGGTFEGPLLKGTIVNGGADYQLADPQGRTELIIAGGKDENGQPTFYFRCAPQFEAPSDSKYGWLNNALFLCAPDFSAGFKGIVLNVWKVK